MFATPEAAMQASEEQLLARCRAGDRDALEIVYTRFARDVYRYAYHLLGDPEDAHDIRQETFLRGFQALDSFRGDGGLRPWLLKICTNLCRRHVQRRHRQREIVRDPRRAPLFLLGTDSTPPNPAAEIERSQTVETIQRALSSLTPQQRELIVLREIEDLSYEEIARILGYSLGSVKVLLFRARRKFIERAEALLQDGDDG